MKTRRTQQTHNQACLSFGNDTCARTYATYHPSDPFKDRETNDGSSWNWIFAGPQLYLIFVTRSQLVERVRGDTTCCFHFSLTVHSRLFFCLQTSGQLSWESSTVSFEILGTCWGYRRPLTGAAFHVQDAPVHFTLPAAWVVTTDSNASICRVSSARTAICAASILRLCIDTLGPSITTWS